jgi:hypothetical protein
MDPATVALDRFGHFLEYFYKALSELCGIPASTLGHRKNGLQSQVTAGFCIVISPLDMLTLLNISIAM